MSQTLIYFLPDLRAGLAAHIRGQEGYRAQVQVTLKASATPIEPGPDAPGEAEPAIIQTVNLYGPGDILGFDARVVRRSDPLPEVFDFEPNYFPAIEFTDPDFAWRFTPDFVPDPDPDPDLKQDPPQLQPWITLIVLVVESSTEGTAMEFREGLRRDKNLPPHIYVNTDVLPDLEQAWRWAHVQVMGDGQADLANILAEHPERGICRLLCARRLAPRTRYAAFVVPTYKSGVLAGLGEAISEDGEELDGLAKAWVSGKGEIGLPYYYRWEFGTGARGDFEQLVRLLEPRPVSGLGTRDLDCQNPGYRITGVQRPGLEAPEAGYLGMEGALRALDTVYTPWGRDPAEQPPQGSERLQEELGELLNRNDPHDTSGNGEELPWVVPPIYGRWHAAKTRVDPGQQESWLAALNLDPRHRAAAGLGAEVVRKQQEALMASAWEQLGEFEQGNELLRQAQLGRESSGRLYRRLELASKDQFCWITSPLHERVEVKTEDLTAHRWLIQKAPNSGAVLDPAFRRIARPRGPIPKRAPASQKKDLLTSLDKGSLEIAGPTPKPIGTDFKRLLPSNGGPSEPLVPRSRDTEDASQDNIRKLRDAVYTELDPDLTIVTRVKKRLQLSDELMQQFEGDPQDVTLDEIMAAPSFPQAMYAPLRELGHELLLPGVERIPQNTVTLLASNRRFLESYLCGLNHEFAAELLWRGYPTDQRGSYFRQFWDVSEYIPPPGETQLYRVRPGDTLESIAQRFETNVQFLRRMNNIRGQKEIQVGEFLWVPNDVHLKEQVEDIWPLHLWGESPLGENHNRTEDGLVLMLRSDLLRRYPDVLIYAVEAVPGSDGVLQPGLPDYLPPDIEAGPRTYPTFRAELPPDLTFFGFPFSREQACGSDREGAGKFFILEERVGTSRFGLDEPVYPPTDLNDWPDLSWSHFGFGTAEDAESGDYLYIHNDCEIPEREDKKFWKKASSATHARITWQMPVRVAVHASQMIPHPP